MCNFCHQMFMFERLFRNNHTMSTLQCDLHIKSGEKRGDMGGAKDLQGLEYLSTENISGNICNTTEVFTKWKSKIKEKEWKCKIQENIHRPWQIFITKTKIYFLSLCTEE